MKTGAAAGKLGSMNRGVLALAALALGLGMGCTDGATPDCTLPDAGCGPDLDGSLTDGTADSIDESEVDAPTGDDAPIDAPLDTGPGDTGQDANDAAGDAAADAPAG